MYFNLMNKNIMEIKAKQFDLDPLTLQIVNNNSNKSFYFTNPFINPETNQVEAIDIKKTKMLSYNNNPMLMPLILLNSSDLLILYNIVDVNDLINYVDENINKQLFDTVNRVVNCWIRENFKYLKKNNKILKKIYTKMFKNYTITENDMDDFLEKWFKENNKDSFKIDLGGDFNKYLGNKYES